MNSIKGILVTYSPYMKQMRVLFLSQEKLSRVKKTYVKILQKFIDMKGKLETSVKNVYITRDIALVISEWSFGGLGPDGEVVSLRGKATDVLRQQSDGTWCIVIDNPWGADISR